MDEPPVHPASPAQAPVPIDPEQMAQQFLRMSREHAVIVTDAAGTVTGWLGAAQRILGYTEAEIVGRPIATLFTPDDRGRDVPWQELEVARTGALSQDDRWHLRSDGTAVWVTGSLAAVRDAGGALLGFVKLMRDRTDLRAHIDSLRHRAETAEAAARQRSGLLETLGHEMRTPLSALSHATLLMKGHPSADTTTAALAVVQRQIAVLQRLAEDLLETARERHGKLELRPQRLDLPQLLRDKLAALQPGYDGKRVDLKATLPRQPLWIDADPVRVQQIVANLLDNALKYTPPGGSVWLKLTIETPHAVVRVEDDGVGIAPDMLPRIFDLFTQEERSSSLAQGGLGIGLALVKAYAELHGGFVEVRSSGIGKGSEFCVRLPMPPVVPPSAA